MKKRSTAIKRTLVLLLATLCLGSLLGLLSGCGLFAPRVGQIYDRVVELCEASKELNTVFYGAGLPVIEKDSEYAALNHTYFDVPYAGYETVTPYAKFLTVSSIKEAAEQVYSRAYLEDVLYPAAFTGYAISDGEDGATVANARYLEDDRWIYRSESAPEYPVEMRIYDYSTMRVTFPSSRKAVLVTMDVYNADGTVEEARLRLVKQEDGQWYLDSFTG